MYRKLCTALAAAAVMCCGGSVLAQSAVGNAGFEVDCLYDLPVPPAGNWTAFFGDFSGVVPAPSMLASIRSSDAGVARSGTSALYVKVTDGFSAFAGMQQPITGLQPGVQYSFTIYVRKANAVNNPVEYRIEWKNSAGGFVGGQFDLNTNIAPGLVADSLYHPFTLTATAPAGTVGANLVIAVQTFGSLNLAMPVANTDIYVDDASFSATSLPTQKACCFADGSCQVVVTANGCPSGSTSGLASGSTCSPNLCPPPVVPAACCIASTGGCGVVLPSTCASLGGVSISGATTCGTTTCAGVPSCRADYNNSGRVDVQDLLDYFSAWLANCPVP